jgi:hypothetical protein
MFSALFDDEEGLSRNDYCLNCWTESRPGAFSFWKTAIPVPDQTDEVKMDRHDVWSLFRSLRDDEQHAALRYVLALVLLRKRELSLVESERTDRGEVMVLTPRASEEQIRVEVVALTPHQFEETREKLSAVMRIGG